MCDILIGLIILTLLITAVSLFIATMIMGESVQLIKEKNIKMYRRLHKGYDFLYPDYVSGKPGTKIQSRITKVLYYNRWKVSEIIGNKQLVFKFFFRSGIIALISFLILFIMMAILCEQTKCNKIESSRSKTTVCTPKKKLGNKRV